MVGASAEFLQGVVEGFASTRVVRLARHGADAGQHELRAKLIRHRHGPIGAGETVVELLDRVERATGGQVQGDQTQLHGADEVTKLATARGRQSVGVEVVGGVEHDAPGADRRGLADLVAQVSAR